MSDNQRTSEISLAREMRGQIFAWIGIVGGALTIVNHWSNFITLADWMHWLVGNFSKMLHEFWQLLIGFPISTELSGSLTFLAFFASLSVGSIFICGKIRRDKWVTNIILIVTFVTICISLANLIGFHKFTIAGYEFSDNVVGYIFGLIPLTTLILQGPTVNKIIPTILLIVLFVITFKLAHEFVVFTWQHLDYGQFASNWIIMFFVTLIFILPLIIAPTTALVKRVAFLLFGVAIIFGLSEVSKQVEHLRTAASTIEAR